MSDDRPRDDEARIDELYGKLDEDAEASGYHLNPDPEFTRELVRGLLVNEERFGYRSCPCRLATGDRASDLDIVCPCDYRDPDLNEWGACYCALYVSEGVLSGSVEASPVPERRPPEDVRRPAARGTGGALGAESSIPVWRCRVCGYLCARERPPETCPICKASSERFEPF